MQDKKKKIHYLFLFERGLVISCESWQKPDRVHKSQEVRSENEKLSEKKKVAKVFTKLSLVIWIIISNGDMILILIRKIVV